jgi:precorrin-3B synthase
MVPLSRLTAAQVRVLAAADRLVLTPWRGVVLPDLASAAAAGWSAALTGAGLPVDAASRWAGVTACAGRPGCAGSLADVRAAAFAATEFVDGLPVHWVGCARGCGSPAERHVRVEATPAGWSVAVPGGTASVAAAGSHSADAHPAGPRSDGIGADGAAGAGTTGNSTTGDVAGLAEIVAKARRS